MPLRYLEIRYGQKYGDKANMENYRPMSLLLHYKLLTNIITNRLSNKLDFFLPVKQAVFQKDLEQRTNYKRFTT